MSQTAPAITRKSVHDVVQWVASGYQHFRTTFPDPGQCSDRDVYHMLLGHRYDVDTSTKELPFAFLAAAVVPGLRGLAVVILEQEAAYLRHEDKMRQAVVACIDEKLTEMGLPLEVIYGVSIDEELDLLANEALAIA